MPGYNSRKTGPSCDSPVHHTKDDGDPLDVFPPSNSRCVSEKESYRRNMKALKKAEKDNGRESSQEAERQ